MSCPRLTALRTALAVRAAVLSAIMVGVSRVYLGDHRPTDVLGGRLVAGAASATTFSTVGLPAGIP